MLFRSGMFYLTGALTSFVFSLLIYSLAISFGDVGKAVVVVVMVLQIAGSSGTVKLPPHGEAPWRPLAKP